MAQLHDTWIDLATVGDVQNKLDLHTRKDGFVQTNIQLTCAHHGTVDSLTLTINFRQLGHYCPDCLAAHLHMVLPGRMSP